MRMTPGAMVRRNRRIAITVLGLAVWLGFPGISRAQSTRTVAVIDATAGTTGDPEVTELVVRLDAQLDREDDLGAVASERRPALVGGIADTRQTATSEARSALTRARDALGRFDHADAIAEADRGLARAVELMPDPEIAKLLADLAFVRGLAQHDAKRNKDASRDFALVHRLDAGRTLDPIKYRPDVVKLFDEAATVGTTTSLDVDAPAGATVWVDGVSVGEAPATVALSPGQHAITVTGERLVTRGQIADVPATGSGLKIRIDAAEASATTIVHRLRRNLAAATTEEARVEAVAALVHGVGAQDAVIVGRDDQGALYTRIYSGRTGTLGEPKPAEDVVPEKLIAPLRPIKRVLPDPDPDPTLPPPPPPPWYKRRWVQASIGGTIVAGVLTTLIVMNAQPTGTSLLTGKTWAEEE
jgi:hypothetical protein